MKTAVIIPAYNSEKSLIKVIESIALDRNDIIVVDDGSKDNTYTVAKDSGVTVLKHEVNKGYGAAQKTAYNYVLNNGYDLAIMIHSDGQHDPTQMSEFVNMINSGYDTVTGTRFKGDNALKQGMPFVRYFGNIILSYVARLFTGLKVSEMHNGYRAYSANALKAIKFNENSDKYEFDTEMLLRVKAKRMKIGEIPIKTIYKDEKSYLNIYSYGYRILSVLVGYTLFRKYRD